MTAAARFPSFDFHLIDHAGYQIFIHVYNEKMSFLFLSNGIEQDLHQVHACFSLHPHARARAHTHTHRDTQAHTHTHTQTSVTSFSDTSL